MTAFTIGATVASEGQTSDRRTGKIKSSSVTATTDNNVKLSDLVLASYSFEAGDSGGIAYMTVNGDNVSAGTTIGKTSSDSVFCKVQNIVDNLGVIPY